MRRGQVVEVREAFENKAVKRVVGIDERNVYVCTEDEYATALVERREPICVGFRRQFVVRVLDESR